MAGDYLESLPIMVPIMVRRVHDRVQSDAKIDLGVLLPAL
jgi:hypothetical protein